ncbi:hypothetical protein LBW62_25160 [Ralstonia solanacearum]|nr:hypothetical protein [Ralstonia solanacearum]MDB0544534.1 hypothetical protein [Ralstonia solanacearum]MDB0554361.1 hypothetical protein [Ralstonia solanacearum]MDB0559454.1 hypothetical protein [Ralstonia solanacearum]
MNRVHRIKGFLTYSCLLISALALHAYALHVDEEAQADLRVHAARQQS